LFHAFPGGRAGAGLLLLRVALGSSALIQGWMYLATRSDSAPGTWAGGLLTVVAGALLLVGFLTPIAAVVAGGFELANAPPAIPSMAFLVAVAAAVALLGPGAFSLDSRCFGLREIIIPSTCPGESNDR
jgi:uncharacterized membrane protein YphA (DoxX/SURF4 family)